MLRGKKLKEKQSVEDFRISWKGFCSTTLESHCPYATLQEGIVYEDIQNDSSEAMYYCSFVKAMVWGEEPECPPTLWQRN